MKYLTLNMTQNDNYGTDETFWGIINKMGDLKLDVSFPNHDYEELNNKFEILRHDFLYNLKVISEKEQLIQKVQRMLEASETLLQKKENELLEIKKECENLSKAQEELCNAYSDLRKTFPTSVVIQDSRENNISEESTIRINNGVRNHPYVSSTRESKLQEQITILEKQLNESTEQNSRLQDQTLLLRQKFKHSTSIYKNELYELKKIQNSLLEQHKDSQAMCLKAKEEIMHLKNVLNLIISLITASRNALKLKDVNLSFPQKANVTTTDIYELIKAFINEIIQKINEYQALSESLQTQLTGNIRENDMLKNYKEKFIQQEKELYKTKQQNSILINVIKEMKQFGQITLDVQKYDPINNHISGPPTGKPFNVQKRESVSHENEPKTNQKTNQQENSVTMCNAEKILMTLNKQIENLVQKGDTDEEGEYQIEKLEDHLSRIKDHLLHQLQEKMIDIEKQESVPSGNIGFCNMRLMLLEEKINQLSSEITSEVACGKELLIETLKDIKTELAGLQHVCQNLKITSNKPNKEKDEMEVIDFRTEIDIEKFKRLEEKVCRLELCVQQKSRATQEYFVSNAPAPLQKFPLEVATPPHSQHFKDTEFPTTFQAERKYHEMYSSQGNIPFQPTHFESVRVPKSKQDSDISIGNTSSDHTHIDYIWNELNEEHTRNILNGKF